MRNSKLNISHIAPCHPCLAVLRGLTIGILWFLGIIVLAAVTSVIVAWFLNYIGW